MSRQLHVIYEISGLSDEEVDELTMEAVVQAERSDGHPGVAVETQIVTPGRTIKDLDPRSRHFLELVEEAWYEETKGELNLIEAYDPEGHDRGLAALVPAMAEEAIEHITLLEGMQFDIRFGYEVHPARVTEVMVAERIARALCVLFWGQR